MLPSSSKILKSAMSLTAILLPVFTSISASTSAASAYPQKQNFDYPVLISKVRSPENNQILKAAKIVFAGKGSTLDADCEPVKRAGVGLILCPTGNTLESQQPGFWSDAASIETNKKADGGPATLYWEKNPKGGGKFAVGQKPMNWQGDWYDLYSVGADMSGEKLEELLTDSGQKSQAVMAKIPEGTAVYRNLWHGPWLFHNARTNHVIAVNTQADWTDDRGNYFPDWTIYATGDDTTAKEIGRIRFAPRVEASQLLPAGPLREMATLLKKIIGIPKEDEGTFHATPRLLAEAQVAWANLALRPWAMAEPANTRKEVEVGLQRWSKGSPAYRKQYEQLKALYPTALESLSRYYALHFHKTPSAARELAAKSLDRVYRSNFKF